MEYYLEAFERCRQHEVSFCTAACPLGVDVNTMISRIQEGRYGAAYKTYRNAAGFPHIAAAICDEPCAAACPLGKISDGDPALLREGGTAGGTAEGSEEALDDNASNSEAIRLRQLERAVLEYTRRKDPTSYNLPKKDRRIAIIGAGVSGMACALRLATKQFQVTVYEKTDTTGGMLPEIMDPELMAMDFDLQMKDLEVDFCLNRKIESLEEIASGFDALYIATGKDGSDFGFPTNPEGRRLTGETDDPHAPCGRIGSTGVFLGGSLLGRSPVEALSDGLFMATAIDNFLMTGNLKYPVRKPTRCAVDEAAVKTGPAVIPASGDLYTKEEGIAEAGRCLKCQCSGCRLHSDLVEYARKWPLRLRDELLATTAPGKSELHATPAVRLINSCTQDGVFCKVCPEGIDLDGMIQAARFRMHKLGKMPWAFNDFFLRDLDFTQSDAAFLSRRAPDGELTPGENRESAYAFFPGCQLAAGEPELVMDSYEYLLSHAPDTGLMLGCCGVPALWAGDEDRHGEVISRLRREWEALGKPTLVLACPTCRNQLAQFLPEAETVFLYHLIDRWGLPDDPEDEKDSSHGQFHFPSEASVFDPCATSSGDSVRHDIRSLCAELGMSLTSLPVQEKWTACCSFGGHGEIADPEFASFVRGKRIRENDLPYITYCINCRDAFLTEGKETAHILNLIFNRPPETPTVTRRRINRIRLKRRMLERFWQEETAGSTGEEEMDRQDSFTVDRDFASSEESIGITLLISPQVRKKISDEYILEQDAANVIAFCERTGRTLRNEETGTLTGYRKVGNLTLWAEYRPTEEEKTYELLNAYTHRMEIELEMVWNGEKIDIDL